MQGEAGSDHLYGRQGTNCFYGGDESDVMFGRSGLNIFISSDEFVYGDVIYGGSGRNYVYGSSANDTVTGGIGVDVFLMSFGDDIITGGGGVDYVWGGLGTDTFSIDDRTTESMVVQDFFDDVLRASGTSLHSFANVQAGTFYAAGINTTIITDAAGSAVWLIGCAPGQLHSTCLVFRRARIWEAAQLQPKASLSS
ncbi:hypothetical protein [Bradyrhizobium sp. JYMT SZCCT0428]|uniref:hypothetical protein n=1 Tax=Bradyrhizobium sp. JYMT SZCCT0428 TaxID=2807673 RepID=UPI002011BFDF|nr:hypothetical protein [Bradyrhizobium sp. JYMT SZCCT0428]